MNVLETIQAASAAKRQVTLCLGGALLAEHDKLREAFAQASVADSRVLDPETGLKKYGDRNPGPRTLAAADAMDEVGTRMAAFNMTFTFQRLPWEKRLALQAAHPPRDGNVLDAMEGANTETYMPVLVKESCMLMTGADGDELTDIPPETFEATFAILTLGQFNELFEAAKNVNDVAPAVPFSARAFLTSQDLGVSSKPPAPGESHRNGSKAGPRRTSRRSPAIKKAASSDTPQPVTPSGTTTPVTLSSD